MLRDSCCDSFRDSFCHPVWELAATTRAADSVASVHAVRRSEIQSAARPRPLPSRPPQPDCATGERATRGSFEPSPVIRPAAVEEVAELSIKPSRSDTDSNADPNAEERKPIALTARPSNVRPCAASRSVAEAHKVPVRRRSARSASVGAAPRQAEEPIVCEPNPDPALTPNADSDSMRLPSDPTTSPIRTRTTSGPTATIALVKSAPGPSTTSASRALNSSHTEATPLDPNLFHQAHARDRPFD